jgi:hypothetical protein
VERTIDVGHQSLRSLVVILGGNRRKLARALSGRCSQKDETQETNSITDESRELTAKV